MGRLLLRPGQDWMRSGNSGPDVSNNGSSCPSIQHTISKVVRFCKCQENPRIQGFCTKTIEGRISSDCSAEICKKLPRRAILPLIGVTMIFTNVYAVFAAPVKEIKEPEILRILKLASGVRIQDVVEGEGQEAGEGDIVEFNYVCRRSNGYFVHSSVDQFSGESSPVILPLDDKQIIKGLKEVLIGMKVGGKRRALIPPSVGYVSETLQPIPEEFGPRRSLLSHAKEPLVSEVQLLKVL